MGQLIFVRSKSKNPLKPKPAPRIKFKRVKRHLADKPKKTSNV